MARMTYHEAAAALGITLESVRRTARKKRWAKLDSNDGLARIEVPDELLAECPKDSPEDRPKDTLEVLSVLTRHIERLELALEAAQDKAEALERERDDTRSELRVVEKARDAIAAQVEALNTVLAVERERTAAERARVEEWKAVADRFATQAEKLTEAAKARRGWWPFRRRA